MKQDSLKTRCCPENFWGREFSIVQDSMTEETYRCIGIPVHLYLLFLAKRNMMRTEKDLKPCMKGQMTGYM